MKTLFLIFLLLIVSASTYAQSGNSNHYEIDVAVEPANGYLKAHCRLHLVADKPMTEIVYWLNNAFRPIEVTGEKIDSVWFTNPDHLSSQLTEVHIRFKQELKKTSKTILDFTYEGTLNADQFVDRGTIVPAWTELSVGALWYPISLEEIMLTYDITLTAPAKYTVVSAGKVLRQGDTQWMIREETITPGRIILMLSDQIHQVRTRAAAYTVDFYVLDPADSLVDSLQVFAQQLLPFFDERFGAVQSEDNRMKIFYPNRDIEGVSKGAFSSTGKFVMLNNKPDTRVQFRILGHELAHFWWRHGLYGTYHDFLNEGLAEFSMLLAFREKYGEKSLLDLTSGFRRKTQDLGSIKSWDIHKMGARTPLLYWKGSLVMFDLLDKIGEEKMYAILRRTSSEKISRYEDFLQIIEEVTSSAIATEFDQQF